MSPPLTRNCSVAKKFPGLLSPPPVNSLLPLNGILFTTKKIFFSKMFLMSAYFLLSAEHGEILVAAEVKVILSLYVLKKLTASSINPL